MAALATGVCRDLDAAAQVRYCSTNRNDIGWPPMTPERNSALLALVCILLTIVLRAAATQNATKMLPELAVQITDYAALPMTGSPDGTGNNAGSLARVNVLREEPGGLRRLFVNDLTGPLYILDKTTKKATTYLDFNGRGTRTGLFDRVPTDAGLASGFISFEFDPDYARNGRFYTIHLEEIALAGAQAPDNGAFPGLKTAGYAPTPPIVPPGTVDHEGVLIEWTDSNVNNSTFEGTVRELMRIALNGRIHPLGDLTFNPVARRGDPDWRVLYVACGDGGSGDQKTAIHLNPQRLDTIVGKVLRIIPDLSEQKDRSVVSENGRYRIPRDNPFVSVKGARPEIWAYGLRNPHRLSWDIDPARPSNPTLIATIIGFRTWETVAIIRRGANYGFPEREGPQMFQGDQSVDPPQPDTLPVHVTDTLTNGTIAPTYPVLAYGHGSGGGDAIAGGFTYRGTAVPQLAGTFIFGDISTGRLWYANVADMLAADDGVARTMAETREVRIWWDDPTDSPDRGKQLYPTMRPIVEAAYRSRGGKALPGTATVAGAGRVDLRFGRDRSGELYFMSKSDGMIRRVTGVGAVRGSAGER
jgi:hypothetical protein